MVSKPRPSVWLYCRRCRSNRATRHKTTLGSSRTETVLSRARRCTMPSGFWLARASSSLLNPPGDRPATRIELVTTATNSSGVSVARCSTSIARSVPLPAYPLLPTRVTSSAKPYSCNGAAVPNASENPRFQPGAKWRPTKYQEDRHVR